MTIDQFSKLAGNLTNLSISELSKKIEKNQNNGDKIFNFTLGDFSPSNFPIPKELEIEIVKAYQNKYTNYPTVGGMQELKQAVSLNLQRLGHFEYSPDEILIASGSRALIYLSCKTLLNPGENIVYTIPSWNNQNFTYLSEAQPIIIHTKPENNFLVSAAELEPHLKLANMIILNSPLNPSGTIFSDNQLREILQSILKENRRRIKEHQKPLYIVFDIVYWLLTYTKPNYLNPLQLLPEIRDYLIFIDGISKCFAATGIRVGWTFGPKPIIAKMRSMLAHIGAWAPKPEQIATANYLQQTEHLDAFLENFKNALLERLNIFYNTVLELKKLDYDLDVLKPHGAIYLAMKINLIGYSTPDNYKISNLNDILNYLLKSAKLALTPFTVFGMEDNFPWFILAVGTCSLEEAKISAKLFKQAIINLN